MSAPGKVLVAGGYLVTLRPHPGLVFSVSARLYAAVGPAAAPASSPATLNGGADQNEFGLVVDSPQFRKTFRFSAALAAADGSSEPHLLLRNSSGEANEFIETTLVSALTAGVGLLGVDSFRARMGAGVVVTILGDAAFYSAPETPESEPKKTGLGSSAALVSSLVAALLSYLGLLDLSSAAPDVSRLQLAHNLAQYCHYKAQGKIGSGFDVSSAVFGSQIYTRFSPDVLLAVPALQLAEGEVGQGVMASPTTPANMVAMLNSPLWDSKAESLQLPHGMHLLLGDISVGAKTPGMVAAVDRWRHALKDQGKLDDSAWTRLAGLNAQMIGHFRRLNALADERRAAYESTLERLAALPADQWRAQGDGADEVVVTQLLALRAALVEVRRNLKLMGDLSGAAIEPDVQTQVCDATMALPGVLLAGVPGAGGMDALFAVALGATAQAAVQELWASRGISPLLLEEDHKGLCAHSMAYFADLRRRSVPNSASS